MKNENNYMSSAIYSDLKNIRLIGLITLFICSTVFVFAQDTDPVKTRLSLVCTQLGEKQVEVMATLKARINKKYSPVQTAEVEIYALTDSSDVLLGKDISNAKGIVRYIIDSKDILQLTEGGTHGVKVVFRGDEGHKSSKRTSSFKPAVLEIITTENDSVKTIEVQLVVADDTAASLSGVEISIQVPRMFSNLPIETETTDDNGKAEFTFPNDLPGGFEGILDISAIADDTDEYATLQNNIKKEWGIPVTSLVAHTERELFSPNAPLWMVLSFAMLMILVWGHFIIVIYKLNLVRKEGKLLAQETS